MNNLANELNKSTKKKFIPFITVGDGGIGLTKELVSALQENGADAIELGIPFSDPLAEGPIISKASARAINGGINTEKVFKFVEDTRKDIKIPLIFMTYSNVIFGYGTQKFIKTSSDIGISAIIVPDCPFEERGEFLPFTEKNNIDLISMISPTSSAERIKKISKNSDGFLYCVSSLGITGLRDSFASNLENMITLAKNANSSLLSLIGFGISNPTQAKNMAKISDGVIIGSRIVKIVEEKKDKSVNEVAQFARSIRQGLDELES